MMRVLSVNIGKKRTQPKGNALEITPGAMNLMTAGRGIAHSERTPASARRTA